MIRKQGIGRNTLALVVANGISSVLSIVRGFYIARFLVPADYGVWSLISALMNYANYADVGINTGMMLEVPKLMGQDNTNEARRVQRQAYSATLAVCGAMTFFLTLISFLPFQLNGVQIIGIRIVAAAVLVFALLNYYTVVVRIREGYRLIGLSTVITAIVGTSGIIVASVTLHTLRMEIVAWISLLGSAAAALLLGFVARPQLAWPLDGRELRRLMKIGLVVSLLPIAFTLFQSIDRWIVAMYVPASALGYYGLGATMGLLLYMLPNTLAIVLFTRQIERFGATGDPKASESLVSAPLFFSGYIMAFVAGGLTLSMPFLIHYLVPVYSPGTRAATFQVIGNCLLFAVPVASNFLISTGRKEPMFGALAVGTIVEAGLVFVLVQTSWGIDGAALAVLISDAVYGGSVAYLAVRLLGGTTLRQLGRAGLCFAPFAVCLPVAGFLLMDNPLSGAMWTDVIRLTAHAIVYMLICVPICLVVASRSGLSGSTVFGAVRKAMAA